MSDAADLLDDELRSLEAEARRFARETLAARAEPEGDLDEAARACVRRLGEAGLLRWCVPAAYGGARERVSLRALCLLREEIAAVSGFADAAFALQALGSHPIALAGSEESRRRWLPAVARGEAIAAFALTEPEAGSDLGSARTRARRDGEGWVLDGTKTFVSNAGIADFYVVLARSLPDEGGRALSLFLVEAGSPGLERGRRLDLLAPHPIGEIVFRGCRIPRSGLLGAEGEGLKAALATLDLLRVSVGSAAVGFGRRALEEALGYARRRVQFGRPIGEFQGLQFYLAEMAAEVEAARAFVRRTAALRDAPGERRMTKEAALVKLFATEAGQRVVDRAVQVHGGLGVVRGSAVERLYREVRALRIYEGTSEVLKVVAAKALLEDRPREG